MRALGALWRSTVGRKALAAISALALSGWIVLPVAGNLGLFRGAPVADAYAAALREAPIALWAVRLGLVLALVVHVVAVTSLARAGRIARPRHAIRAARGVSAMASRSM